MKVAFTYVCSYFEMPSNMGIDLRPSSHKLDRKDKLFMS